MQRLGHCRIARATTLAGARAFGAAENLEKVRRQSVVPQLDRTRAGWPAGILFVNTCGIGDSIEHYLSRQPTDVMTRKILLVVDVRRASGTRKLIRSRIEDQPHRGLQIVMLARQLLGQEDQQWVVRRGIGGS